MLVVTRRIGESIFLPSVNIEVMVVSIRSMERVRIGIKAPSDVPILRNELVERHVLDTSSATGDDTDGRLSGNEK